jgi:hypothetical protein
MTGISLPGENIENLCALCASVVNPLYAETQIYSSFPAGGSRA